MMRDKTMKRKMTVRRGAQALLVAALMLVSGFSAQAAIDEEYWLPPDVYPLRVGFFPPVQLPIPWLGYTEETPWDIYEVYGIDLALVWSANVSLYGLGCGGYMNTSKDLCGFEVNVVGRAGNAYGVQLGGWNWDREAMYGLQVGAINVADDAAGLQIGLWNWTTKAAGLQIGLLNWTDEMAGLQIGLANVITKGPLTAMVIANAQF